MARMTKRQYLTSKARLTEERAATVSRLTALDQQYAGHNVPFEVSDEWNALHEYVWEIDHALQDLESTWATRHWTATDWTAYQLILQNMGEPPPETKKGSQHGDHLCDDV